METARRFYPGQLAEAQPALTADPDGPAS